MARARRHEEEHDNHDRWMVSYADFITLLFAFFVVMYAISSVNEGKYRVLSDSLVAVFQSTQRSPNVVNIGEPPRAPMPSPDSAHPGTRTGGPELDTANELEEAGLEGSGMSPRGEQHAGEQPSGDAAAGEQASGFKGAPAIAESIESALNALIDKQLVAVQRGAEWVEVEMKSNILFDSGSSRLSPEAIPILTEVAGALNTFSNPMQVEGFTDNKPINTIVFPSNWELSAARAASVVHLFSRLDVDPQRMAAVGYGEFRPKADNETAEGRAQNRRVVVRISTVVQPEGAAPAVPSDEENVAQPLASPPAAPVFKSIDELPGREGPDQ